MADVLVQGGNRVRLSRSVVLLTVNMIILYTQTKVDVRMRNN